MLKGTPVFFSRKWYQPGGMKHVYSSCEKHHLFTASQPVRLMLRCDISDVTQRRCSKAEQRYLASCKMNFPFCLSLVLFCGDGAH